MPLYIRTNGTTTLLQVAGIGPAVGSLAALRALGHSERADRQSRGVDDGSGAEFTFSTDDGAGVADDDINVVRPDDVPEVEAGRWYRTPRVATSTTYGV